MGIRLGGLGVPMGTHGVPWGSRDPAGVQGPGVEYLLMGGYFVTNANHFMSFKVI